MDNKLEGEIPEEIAQLKNLEELILSNNGLTGDLPLALMNLIKLNTLMVSDNKLNEDYISISGKNPPSLLQLQQIQSATATMDVEKE